MKIKVGDIITLKKQPMSGPNRTRKVLAVFEDGVLVPYYPIFGSDVVVPPGFVPFSNIEEPPTLKALPGVVYMNTGQGIIYSIGLTNGKLGWVAGGELLEVDLTDQWEPVK